MTTPENVFAGPAIELPTGQLSKLVQISSRAVEEGADGVAATQPTTDLSAPLPLGQGGLRHAAGYAPFAASVLAHGVEPRSLAAEPLELLRFLRAHASADPELRRAACVFLGNSIAALRPDALWRSGNGWPDQVGAGRSNFMPERILNRLTGSAHAEADVDGFVEGFIASLQEWVREAEDDALPPPPLPSPVPPASGTPHYVRPELPTVHILDEAGEPIPYGSRWGSDGPPEDSYSVDAHPERFAGLHTVAHALIEYLDRVYDVEVISEPVTDATLLRPQRDIVELLRVLPRDPEAAPLLFAFTAYPGVIVEAGVLHALPHPICGCEACDETAEAQAGELEQLVFAVIAGGYAEHYPVGRRRELHQGIVYLDAAGTVTGSSRGGGDTVGLSAERLEQGAATLAALPRGWQPWPLR